MKNRSYKRKHKYHINITYYRIKDYNNPRTQNIILYIILYPIYYIIYNNKGYNKIIIPDQGFNKIIESLNQIY